MVKVKRIVTTALVSVMLATSLTACGDPEGYKKQIEELKLENEGLYTQIDSLNALLGGMQITEQALQTSLQSIEGKEVPEFVTIENAINFPNTLHYPESTEDINNSNVMVGSRYQYSPSSNWLVRVNGTTLELNHPAKIWGKIKAFTSQTEILEEEMKANLQSFFTGFPATNIEYRRIYIDERISGMIATAPITVDGKKHVVTVGFAIRSELGQLYMFNYEDNESGVQQELIDLLIASGMYSSSKLILE